MNIDSENSFETIARIDPSPEQLKLIVDAMCASVDRYPAYDDTFMRYVFLQGAFRAVSGVKNCATSE